MNSSTIAMNTAEIFYPSTQRWVNTSPMGETRSNHTATLLPNGNVLVTGGRTASGGYSNSAEIYITTSSKWVSAGTFIGARAFHTAALLKDGRVLIGGGIGPSGAINTTRIYNPTTNSWSDGPTLNNPRYYHTANLLKDGRVLFMGGSDNNVPLRTAEICTIGGSCSYTGNNMLTFRAQHTSVLLPNGKILVMGGEKSGEAINFSEGYDVDFSTWQIQGNMNRRVGHTSILTQDGYVMNIGGYDGAGTWLNTTEKIYFSYDTDASGLPPKERQPLISTGTLSFDKSDRITLISDTSNFHSITEASSGKGNESFHNPRIYISQIDNPSGFLTDLTTSLYTLFGSVNSSWEKTTSSLTLIMPSQSNELPYGYYNFWVANNGIFSDGFTVQVTSARPTGQIANIAGTVLSTTSVSWTWNVGSLTKADGYALFSSSNNVFISTAALDDPATFIQSNLMPNTPSSIKVGGFNIGGYSPDSDLVEGATVYTYANAPANLSVTYASFETAALEWSPEGNSSETIYEVTIAEDSGFTINVSTPIPFNDNYTSTSATINQLSPNLVYYFRVRAQNGDGVNTNYSNTASTVTVANINNLQGTPLDMSSIGWSWDESAGADWYEIYDITNGTSSPVFIASTTLNHINELNLSTNAAYKVSVNAGKGNFSSPIAVGPKAESPYVYTLAVDPLPGVPNAFTSITTGSFKLNWIANGNPPSTIYSIAVSTGDPAYFDASRASTNTVMATDLTIDGLTPNTSYYAMISAINGDGIPTDYVSLGGRYTRAQPPSNVTASEVSMSGVTLVWDTGDNPSGTQYEVRGSTDNWISISTFIPFALLYTENYATINGLYTSTTYYFDVAARNAELIETARTPCVPNVYTVDGPENAPAGSIGGTSDPSATSVISGTLPNGRSVSMTIPASAFPDQTAIAIAASANNYCGDSLGIGYPIEVTIYASNHLPYSPVNLELNYFSGTESTKISDNPNVVMAIYDPTSGQCRSLKTTINTGFRTITAELDHFSTFQLISKAAASDLNNILVYPNPLRLNRPGNGSMKFENLPAYSTLKIYTLSGVKIWEGVATATGLATWNGKNKYGSLAASGVYICLISSSSGKKIVKIAVER